MSWSIKGLWPQSFDIELKKQESALLQDEQDEQYHPSSSSPKMMHSELVGWNPYDVAKVLKAVLRTLPSFSVPINLYALQEVQLPEF